MSNRNTIQGGVDSVASSVNSTKENLEKRRVEEKDSQSFQEMLKRKSVDKEENQVLLNDEQAIKTPLQGMPTPPIPTGALNNSITSVNSVAPIEHKADALLPDLINQIVQRITTVSSEHHKEIRITLQEHVLQGTEIRITAENQHLAVQFITTSGHINQWLEQKKLTVETTLETELAKKDRQMNVVVLVTSDQNMPQERSFS